MANKKYYWLKLHKDFFKSHEIKVIESMDNGKDYVLFYLKLLLESVSHEGRLRFSDMIPYNEQMLASITNTNIDVVRSAMKIFQELNMVDVLADETIYMREVETMIGSETKWADYKRLERKRDDLDMIGQPLDIVQQSIEIRDKSIENRDKSIDIINNNIVEQDSTTHNSIVEIIDYLNLIGHTNYKPSTKNTVKHIKARLNEGYTVDDFKTVIDKKSSWIGTNMEQYFRPDTLFGTKFESYLNQKIIEEVKVRQGQRDLLAELRDC